MAIIRCYSPAVRPAACAVLPIAWAAPGASAVEERAWPARRVPRSTPRAYVREVSSLACGNRSTLIYLVLAFV